MNRNTTVQDQSSPLLTVDAAPMPLDLPNGSTIVVYRGEVWITQEGMQDDVILGPGQRFDVRTEAPIVASSTKRFASIVYVARPVDAPDADVHSLLRQRARRLQTEEINRIARIFRERLSRGLAAATAHIRAAFVNGVARPPIRRVAPR
jgi:Protein of unknown function (DUF2917)